MVFDWFLIEFWTVLKLAEFRRTGFLTKLTFTFASQSYQLVETVLYLKMSAPLKDIKCESSEIPPVKRSRRRQKPRPTNSRCKDDDGFRLRVGKRIEADFLYQSAVKFTSNLPDVSTFNLRTPPLYSTTTLTSVHKSIPSPLRLKVEGGQFESRPSCPILSKA